MNLKDAFRFQNKIKALLVEAGTLLSSDCNITTVTSTHMRSKVSSELEDTTAEETSFKYPDHVTHLVEFYRMLLREKAKLASAIREAKRTLAVDIDSESSLNSDRHEFRRILKHMADLKGSDKVSTTGVGYKLNTDGEQVSYRYDVRSVTKINYDRKLIRKILAEINTEADAISSQIDGCLVNTNVNYTPSFDVNDSFDSIFENYCGISEEV